MTKIPGYQRHLYPPGWNAISYRAKARAGWKCEACAALDGFGGLALETHHVDNNPQNNEDGNLIALCHNEHTEVKGMMPQPRTRLEVIQRLRQQGRPLRVRF